MAVPLVPIALGGGVLGLLLLSRRNVVGPPGTQPTPSPIRPNGFPPPNPQAIARVNVTTGEGGLNLRTGPSRTNTTLIRGYVNGTRLAVIAIAPSDEPAPIQWGQVMMQDGATGFVRLRGPNNESNITIESGTLPDGGRGGGEQPVVQGWGGYDPYSAMNGYNPYSAMGGCGPCGGGGYGYGGPWGGWGPGLPYYYGNMEIAGRPARRGYR